MKFIGKIIYNKKNNKKEKRAVGGENHCFGRVTCLEIQVGRFILYLQITVLNELIKANT